MSYLDDIVRAYMLYGRAGKKPVLVDLTKKRLARIPAQVEADVRKVTLVMASTIGEENVGVGIRPHGEFVVDVDDPEAFAKAHPDVLAECQKTYSVSTPRGAHYHFWGDAPTHKKAFTGADIIGATLMVIMPPSRGYSRGNNNYPVMDASSGLYKFVGSLTDTGYEASKPRPTPFEMDKEDRGQVVSHITHGRNDPNG